MKNKQAIIERFGNSSVIRVVEMELTEPSDGEVRVKVEASTVSATDIFIRKGIYPLLKKKPPFTLGYDFVGVIEKSGPGVTTFKTGDRVCGIVMTGGNAEYICVKTSELTRVPAGIDPSIVACLVLSGISAYQMFTHLAAVERGQRILVHGGSGAIGSTLLQLGKLLDCEMVSTASRSRHHLIERLGAKAVDYHDPDYFTQLKNLAGDGFDAAFDFTNQTSFNHSFKLLKKGGKLVTYAVYSSSQTIEKKTAIKFFGFVMDFGWMMLKLVIWNLLPNSKTAQFYGSSDSRKEDPVKHQEDMNRLFEMAGSGLLKPLVYTTLSIAEVPKAHGLLQEGKVEGQIVILPDYA